MNLSEFFNGAVASLPRGGFEAANCTFDVFLRGLFRAYLDEVKKIGDADNQSICDKIGFLVPEIEHVADHVVAATTAYLKGYPSDAYGQIAVSLGGLKWIDYLITEVSAFDPTAPHVPYDAFLESTLHPAMYRMRPNLGLAAAGTLKRKDIFHIPFERRNLVENRRYSISGLPCLYLGSSTWICWEELDRPELNTCICSRFKFAEAATILDFQFPPVLAWTIYENVKKLGKAPTPHPRISELQARYNDDFVVSYILYWPLIAASSIRVDSRAGSFFPHYIVPQLLLQWVTTERKVDGVRYFSTRPTKPDFYLNTNYVFPTRDIQPYGRCSFLRKKFQLVNPVPWALLELIDDPHRTFLLPGLAINENGQIQLSESTTAPYIYTKFYELEKRLGVLETQPDGSGPVEV